MVALWCTCEQNEASTWSTNPSVSWRAAGSFFVKTHPQHAVQKVMARHKSTSYFIRSHLLSFPSKVCNFNTMTNSAFNKSVQQSNSDWHHYWRITVWKHYSAANPVCAPWTAHITVTVTSENQHHGQGTMDEGVYILSQFMMWLRGSSGIFTSGSGHDHVRQENISSDFNLFSL